MHLTIRMAWHDNNWDGKVCQNPTSNTYCTGAHSLLSGRIEKKKDTQREEELKGQEIEGNFDPSNVPPCYWSINAFSPVSFKVKHQHAFTHVKHEIEDTVKPYSVFTWPGHLNSLLFMKRKTKTSMVITLLILRRGLILISINLNQKRALFFSMLTMITLYLQMK